MSYLIVFTQIILALFFFGFINANAEKWAMNVPKWLDYRPFNCRKCLSFWSMLGVALVIGIPLKMWWFLVILVILNILNTVALIINDKINTEDV